MANTSIKVFSIHSRVLARTLVGDESGIREVCLVGKGGEVVKEEVGNSLNKWRELKVRKRQKEWQEKED